MKPSIVAATGTAAVLAAAASFAIITAIPSLALGICLAAAADLAIAAVACGWIYWTVSNQERQ